MWLRLDAVWVWAARRVGGQVTVCGGVGDGERDRSGPGGQAGDGQGQGPPGAELGFWCAEPDAADLDPGRAPAGEPYHRAFGVSVALGAHVREARCAALVTVKLWAMPSVSPVRVAVVDVPSLGEGFVAQ